MKSSEKVVVGVVLLLLISGVVGLNFYMKNYTDVQGSTKDSFTGSYLTGAVIGESADLQLNSILISDVVECWVFNTEADCTGSGAGSCIWTSDAAGNFCERPACFLGDSTNDTYCNVTLNTLYNLSCGYGIFGAGFCDPNSSDGDFFGNGCNDFNADEDSCYSTNFCTWNATDDTCLDPDGFSDAFVGSNNPSCAALLDQPTCQNISGCAFAGGACSGNNAGVSCNNLNKSLCSDFTLLSTCCSWNGTECKVSFERGCYDSVGDLPAGATYCEDTGAFTNETLCKQIAGSPWYMPCAFNQSGNDECHFNNAAFGGAGAGNVASFDEVGTEQGCEAQNGVWRTEQFTNGGVTQTDSWCEFRFGIEHGGGNCDSACWACENSANITTVASGITTCENSDLGYCQFRQDGSAPNQFGYCQPRQEFIDGGGRSCNDECSSCDYLVSPEAECTSSLNNCVWVNDASAPNGVGNCYGANEKRCANDCWSCYTQTECVNEGEGAPGSCSWDGATNFCKPAGFSGEVCFDGKDNDNDGKLDCLDADCATDKFCGGADLAADFGQDCPGLADNTTCVNSGCVWLVDDFDNFFGGGEVGGAGFCDFPGSECWGQDDNETGCGNESSCSWITAVGGATFCGENSTLFDTCFIINNQTGCEDAAGCGWGADVYNSSIGHCEPLVFSQCFGNETRRLNQTNCEINESVGGVSTQVCSWTTDLSNPTYGGFCDPVCFGLSNNTCTTSTQGLCQLQAGFCEPDSFGGTCFNADGNMTQCQGVLNQSCQWTTDSRANNNVSNSSGSGNTSGWCDPKGAGNFINFIGDVEPVIIGVDDDEATVNNSWDISGIGLRDEFNRIVFGSRLQDTFEMSATCNSVPTYTAGTLGVGELNHTFFWYIDADGNTTNNCDARDNSSAAGYEFSFKYQGSDNGGGLIEVRTSYQCVNGSWGAVPIPFSSSKQIMCDVVGGGMAGIDKTELFKFKALFNKTADIRIYATVGNSTTNDSVIFDSAGPYYYSPGSVDFQFEDCSTPGADADGDGISASNDPDCFSFLQFGYVPNEVGFQCGDGIDNDGDGNTDCDDEACGHSFECGGTGVPVTNANDRTAPKITWMQVDPFPDAAFIMYDTNEPSNGTVSFYNTNSSCKSLNVTIRDVGITDSFLPVYKVWHDGGIDNAAYNLDALSGGLINATTYFFKTTVCDINGNCRVSACSNFTTRANFADCKGCKSTFTFPYVPPAGVAVTDPLGNLSFVFELQGGTDVTLDPASSAGQQLNYTQTKNFNLLIHNPNVANDSSWHIRFINASIVGKVSQGVQTFNDSHNDLNFSTTGSGNATFVGLSDTKCQELINTFRPKRIEMGIPGNVSELWQCGTGLTNCTQKTSNATRVGYNVSANLTRWQVPAEWGC